MTCTTGTSRTKRDRASDDVVTGWDSTFCFYSFFFFGSSQPAVEDFPIVQIKMDILAPLCGFMTCYVWRHFACSVFLFLSLHATVFNGDGV